MRKLGVRSEHTKLPMPRNAPSSNEHVEVPGTGLQTDGGQHDRRANPDGDLTAKAIGKIWRERVSGEGADVLRIAG